MNPVFDRLLDAARQLMNLRAALWLVAMAVYGFAFGFVLKNGAEIYAVDVLLFLGALLVGGASYDMKTAELRATRRRQRKLDKLYGRTPEA